MNVRFDIRSCKGNILNVWIIAPACMVFILALCIPGFSTAGKEVQTDREVIDIERPIDPGMFEVMEDIELTGIVRKINVSARDGKYECLVLLNFVRMGNGMEINHLLYFTDRELQSLFELAYAQDKSLRVWGREMPHAMEIDGESNVTFKITRVQI